MRRNLTLRMDADAIKRAKEYAANRGISVSKLVENFFEALEGDGVDEVEMSPLVKSLWGTLEGADVNEDDYRKNLEDKYL